MIGEFTEQAVVPAKPQSDEELLTELLRLAAQLRNASAIRTCVERLSVEFEARTGEAIEITHRPFVATIELALRLLEEYGPRIRRMYRSQTIAGIRRRLGLDDLIQDIAIDIQNGLATCRAESIDMLRGWVFKLVQNRLRTICTRERYRKRDASREEYSPLEQPMDYRYVEAEAKVITEESMKLVTAAIESLPERQRYVVRQSFFEHKSPEEIAAELNTSEGAIRTLKSRGIAAIRAATDDGIKIGKGDGPYVDVPVERQRIGRTRIVKIPTQDESSTPGPASPAE